MKTPLGSGLASKGEEEKVSRRSKGEKREDEMRRQEETEGEKLYWINDRGYCKLSKQGEGV